MTRVFENLDEVRAASGTELGVGDWHEVTQQQIDLFADATGDHQWIHVDPGRARAGPFGTTIAHGFLTLALLPEMAASAIEVRDARMGVNYGLNKVRFPAPLPVGSQWRGGAELIAVDEIPGGRQATVRVTIEVQGTEKPAMVADCLVRVYG